MTTPILIASIIGSGMAGIVIGAVLAGGRAVELLEEVADLESEIDRLRGA